MIDAKKAFPKRRPTPAEVRSDLHKELTNLKERVTNAQKALTASEEVLQRASKIALTAETKFYALDTVIEDNKVYLQNQGIAADRVHQQAEVLRGKITEQKETTQLALAEAQRDVNNKKSALDKLHSEDQSRRQEIERAVRIFDAAAQGKVDPES
jgi:predicted  nucleic acid-binding Zn-ribbon protein